MAARPRKTFWSNQRNSLPIQFFDGSKNLQLFGDFSCPQRGIGDNLTAMTWESLIDLLSREFRHLRRMPVVNFGFATAPVTEVASSAPTGEVLAVCRVHALLPEEPEPAVCRLDGPRQSRRLLARYAAAQTILELSFQHRRQTPKLFADRLGLRD